jgi:hypothetical protein
VRHTVSHPKLITKLESYGFSGHLLSWIKAFLSNRTQAVTILECPTLFLIYINDICEAVADLNVSVKLFADDAKLYSVLDFGLSHDLSSACSRIASWAENWQMF